MLRLYWVRHGENPANLTKEFSCRRVDYPLTPKGVLQAQQTAEYFAAKTIHAVYASPLKRAVQTAEIIAVAHRLPVAQVEGFREVDVGELEDGPPGAAKWALHNAIVTDWLQGKVERSFPAGENQLQVWQRMRDGLKQIIEHGGARSVVVVSHGGILYLTIGSLCPQVGRASLPEIHNCAVSEILLEQRDGELYGELVSWAEFSHLYGEAAELVSGLADVRVLNGGG